MGVMAHPRRGHAPSLVDDTDIAAIDIQGPRGRTGHTSVMVCIMVCIMVDFSSSLSIYLSETYSAPTGYPLG
jgi:hypothetical protein